MANNLVIMGLKEEKGENTAWKSLAFFQETMELENIDPSEILKAHRIGPIKKSMGRPMIALVLPKLKNKVMNNLKQLWGKKNHKEKPYFVNVQMPDAMIQAKRNAKSLLKKYEEKNKKLPQDRQVKVEIKGDTRVYVNNVLEKDLLQPPLASWLVSRCWRAKGDE